MQFCAEWPFLLEKICAAKKSIIGVTDSNVTLHPSCCVHSLRVFTRFPAFLRDLGPTCRMVFVSEQQRRGNVPLLGNAMHRARSTADHLCRHTQHLSQLHRFLQCWTAEGQPKQTDDARRMRWYVEFRQPGATARVS